METDNRLLTTDNRSGHDLDVWGGERTTPVLIPKPGEPCVRHDKDGRCPAGCSACTDFERTYQMPETDSSQSRSPWDDPMVKAALQDGQTPEDIILIDCPDCGVPGYYNQGSHFTCRICGASFSVVTEEEYIGIIDQEGEHPARRYLVLGDEYSLADYEPALEGDIP